MNEHVAGEDLAAYLDGRLQGEAAARAEAHLCRCRDCREELAEIVAIRDSREKAPDEFLRRALAVPAGVARGGNTVPVRRVLLLRPAFGIAAAFLVAVMIGYFYLVRGGKTMPAGPRPQEREWVSPAGTKAAPPADEAATREAWKDKEAPLATAEKDRPGPSKAAQEASPSSARLAEAQQPAAPSPGLVRQESLADGAQSNQESAGKGTEGGVESEVVGGVEGGVVGGVVGGVMGGIEQAPAGEAESESKQVSAETAAPAVRGTERKPEKRERLLAGAPAQAKASAQDQRRQFRHGPNADDAANAANAAAQIMMAVNGQAAAPLAIQAPIMIRIAGDVGPADLLDPGQLIRWQWFPRGRGLALELEIAADGKVSAVRVLGAWDADVAERARQEARRLAFAASEKKTRRAMLAAAEGPN